MKKDVCLECYCSNYFDWLLKRPALYELKHQCEKNGYLKCPASLYLVFEEHNPSLRIIWNRKKLIELVYLMRTLIDNKYIRIKGDRGFWTAIEKHLYDFDGLPIKTSLSDVYRDFIKNKNAYFQKIEKVDNIIKKVLAKNV